MFVYQNTDIKWKGFINYQTLLPNNKSPGSDGFTTNFYKFFWIDIKDFLFDSFRYSFTHGTLNNDQKLGVLNLIPKTQKDL